VDEMCEFWEEMKRAYKTSAVKAEGKRQLERHYRILQEVSGRINRLLPSIQHGPYRNDATNNSSIASAFVAAGICLLSRCLTTIWVTETHRQQCDLINLLVSKVG
jgi:hypothetical protein